MKLISVVFWGGTRVSKNYSNHFVKQRRWRIGLTGWEGSHTHTHTHSYLSHNGVVDTCTQDSVCRESRRGPGRVWKWGHLEQPAQGQVKDSGSIIITDIEMLFRVL